MLHRAVAISGYTTIFVDTFETDKGWTPTNAGATAGDWVRDTPINDGGGSDVPGADDPPPQAASKTALSKNAES